MRSYATYILSYLFFVMVNLYGAQDLKALIINTIPFRQDEKIFIPPYIKHIKLDIGLSYSAPMSQYWLTHENDLMVFGFEPNPASIASILNGAIKIAPSHGTPLEKRFIGNSFFLIPCALGLSQEKTINFFVTKGDCGCSSIFEPTRLEIERLIQVPIFTLSDFFDLFPFDTHPVIDYIKIDAQGADLDIVKSAGNYLADHVIWITLEPENDHYKGTKNSAHDIRQYMESIGFVEHPSSFACDPTYFNPRFTEYVKTNSVAIYQIQ